MPRLIRLLALLACLCSLSAGAEQSYFHRNLVQSEFDFVYQWRDLDDQPRQLRFQVPSRDFLNTPVSFRSLSRARINRESRRALLEFAQKQGWHDVELRLANHGDDLDIIIRQGPQARRTERQAVLQRELRRIQNDIMQENYYHRFTDHTRRHGYKPDHTRIARQSEQHLRPVALSFAAQLEEQASPRDTLRLLLSFIQSVPYADLNDRFSSPGAGYHPPTRVLFENRGDCDSKVTLLATLYSLLHPNVETLIVYLPGHAVFAANIEPHPDDYWIWHEGQQYVVADPTGPVPHEPGQVAPGYQVHVYNGALVTESF